MRWGTSAIYKCIRQRLSSLGNLLGAWSIYCAAIFGRSDERFTGHDTIYSASIASDRAGNERAVNVCKRSGVIQRGFKPGMDAQMFQDDIDPLKKLL